MKITISWHLEIEKYIVGQIIIWLTWILLDSFTEPLLQSIRLVKVSPQIFSLARKSAQNEIVGHINNAAALM